MPTSNQEIIAEMQELQPIHTKLHQTVRQIKDLAAMGKVEESKLLMQNTLLPLSGHFFAITGRMNTLADIYQNKFKELNALLLVEAIQQRHDTFQILDDIVEKAVNYAEELGNSAKTTAHTGKTMMLIGIITGTILALLLGVGLTLLITQPLSQGTKRAREISEGDMTQALDIDQKDEIGLLAGALIIWLGICGKCRQKSLQRLPIH